MFPMKPILLVAAVFVFAPANAQQASQIIDIKPGFSVVHRFDRLVKTLAIGNPEIVDAVVQNDRAILISARRVGETNLIGIDQNGVDFFHATVVVGGGETGRVQIHSRRSLNEYWTYRCSETGCQRLEDKFERTAPPAQVFVRPPQTQVCNSPDDIAADGTRCGDRAPQRQPDPPALTH